MATRTLTLGFRQPQGVYLLAVVLREQPNCSRPALLRVVAEEDVCACRTGMSQHLGDKASGSTDHKAANAAYW